MPRQKTLWLHAKALMSRKGTTGSSPQMAAHCKRGSLETIAATMSWSPSVKPQRQIYKHSLRA
jgi:hypothetical protein